MAIKVGDTVVISDTGKVLGVDQPKVGISTTVIDTPVSSLSISLGDIEYDRYEVEMINIGVDQSTKVRVALIDPNGSVYSSQTLYKGQYAYAKSSTNGNLYQQGNYVILTFSEDVPSGNESSLNVVMQFQGLQDYAVGKVRFSYTGGYLYYISGVYRPMWIQGWGNVLESPPFTEETRPSGLKFFLEQGSSSFTRGRINLWGLKDPS